MLRTKRSQSLFDPMMVNLNKLKEMSKNNDETTDITLNKDMIVEHFQRIIKIMFDEFSQYPNEEIEDILPTKTKLIQNFDELFSTNFNDEKMLNTFLQQFKCALVTKEKLECIEIKRLIETFYGYIREMGEAEQIEHILNIKETAIKLLELFQLLLAYGKNLISQLLKEKIIICMQQLYISFEMLAKLVKEQHKLKLPIFSTKKYLCNRICVCLNKLSEVLEGPSPIDDEIDEKSNHFVYKMDLALDLLSELTGKNQQEQIDCCPEIWLAIEDVFTHAMSIAQVCKPENFEAVNGICQAIVSEYENLKRQLSSVPREIALNGLFIKTTTDGLYRLERQINISVLTLVMDVFSNPFCALAKLIDKCGSPLLIENRNRDDIAADLEHFDGISDEVMQIGFYAMACCRDINRVIKIKNIMASLESIELELIPTLTLFYLNPKNEELRAGAKLLTDHWQKDIREFRSAVETIIDPAAFCQIVLDDLQERVTKMNYSLDNHIPLISTNIKTFVLRACTLAMQITLTIEDIGEELIDKQTIMMIRELKTAVYEASAAEKRFRSIIMTDPEQLRLIKRCELVINVIKRLQPALVTVMNNWETKCSNESSKNFNSSSSNYGSFIIKTPYTVDKFKLSISIKTEDVEGKTPMQRSCLIPYIKQGRTVRTGRSIMYRDSGISGGVTPFKKQLGSVNRDLSCVRQHLFSRDSSVGSGQLGEVDWNNASYDLTCILSELSADSLKIVGDDGEIGGGFNLSEGGGGDATSLIEKSGEITGVQ